jgi:hypothetical protein
MTDKLSGVGYQVMGGGIKQGQGKERHKKLQALFIFFSSTRPPAPDTGCLR